MKILFVVTRYLKKTLLVLTITFEYYNLLDLINYFSKLFFETLNICFASEGLIFLPLKVSNLHPLLLVTYGDSFVFKFHASAINRSGSG